MAEFTAKQGAFLIYQNSVKLKTQLMNLSTLTERQVRNLLFQLRGESDREFARLVRQLFPKLMEESAVKASLLTAYAYNEAREINKLTAGTAIALSSNFVANPEAYIRNDGYRQVIDNKMNDVSYNFNKLWSPEQVYDLQPVTGLDSLSEKSRSNFITVEQVKQSHMNETRKNKLLQVLSEDGKINGFVAGKREIEKRVDLEKPLAELVARSPLDFSFVENTALMESDPHAGEHAKRITRGSASCTFCKHMATFVGDSNFKGDAFHNHCKCTPGPSFAYEADYQPDWSGEYEEEYYRVQDELLAEAKNFEKRRVNTQRYSESKGKMVNTTSVIYVDKRTGKQGTPPKTSTKAILNKIARDSRGR